MWFDGVNCRRRGGERTPCVWFRIGVDQVLGLPGGAAFGSGMWRFLVFGPWIWLNGLRFDRYRDRPPAAHHVGDDPGRVAELTTERRTQNSLLDAFDVVPASCARRIRLTWQALGGRSVLSGLGPVGSQIEREVGIRSIAYGGLLSTVFFPRSMPDCGSGITQ